MSSLVPVPFHYGKVHYVDLSSDSAYANEAMEEVNLLATEGRARYTVYRITDPDKRVMHDNVTATFQKQVHGAGDWVALTPSEVWYAVGYIILGTALNNDDVVRCATGNYCASTQLFGVVSRGPVDITVTGECTCDQDTAVKRAPIYDDWNDRTEIIWAKLRSERTTTGGAANSHMKLEHMDGGVAGDLVSLEITNPGGNGALAISVVDQAITVEAARSGGVITSRAREIIRALNSNASVAALKVLSTIPSGEDGSGLVAVYAHTHLQGGKDRIDLNSYLGTTIVMEYYDIYASGIKTAGYGILEKIDWSGDPKSFVKGTLNISGARNRLYRVAE